jgi:hypothetical protein
MRRVSLVVLCASVLAGVSMPAGASATPAQASLTGVNGEGTFDDTLACGQGDGPSWRYYWLDQPATSPGGIFAGTWNGTFEVHDAGGRTGAAFIPDGDGRIAITLDRGGAGFFDLAGGGDCANPTLALARPLDGPVASGTLPVVATGGTGALRGLTGSGTAGLQLQLGPGADNAATVDLTGDWSVTAPAVSVTGASSRWQNLSAFLAKRLDVTVGLADAPGVGDAFETRITGVSGGSGSFAGVPTGAVPRITAGGGSALTFTMLGAAANRTYTLDITLVTKDGLLAPQAPQTATVTFKSPLLP